MRVLVTVPTVPARLDSRVPWHFFQELDALAKLGHELLVVSRSAPEYSLPGVEFRQLSMARSAWSVRTKAGFAGFSVAHANDYFSRTHKDLKRWLRTAGWNFNLARIAEAWRPSVIHSHWAFPASSAGALAAQQLGVPLVMTLRGIDHLVHLPSNYGDTLDPFVRESLVGALQAANAVTICCSDSERRLRELGFNQWEKVSRVFHAVNSSRFCLRDEHALKTIREEYDLDGADVIVCVALMDGDRKGHKVLFRAVRNLITTRPTLKLLLVGDGSSRAELERDTQALGIAPNIVFCGAQHPNVIKNYLQVADVSVLPTYADAFANVVFESLAAGTPVVATEAGTPSDVLPLGPYGTVCRAGDSDGLARAISFTFQHRSEAKAMAKKGGEFVLKEMSLERRVGAFDKIYRKLG